MLDPFQLKDINVSKPETANDNTYLPRTSKCWTKHWDDVIKKLLPYSITLQNKTLHFVITIPHFGATVCENFTGLRDKEVQRADM